MLGRHYGEQPARETAQEVLRTICHAAYRASVDIAREKGAFPALARESYLEAPFVRRLPQDLRAAIRQFVDRELFSAVEFQHFFDQLLDGEHGIEPRSIIKDVASPLVAMAELDYYGPGRKPLRAAEDAVVIDASDLSVAQVVTKLLKHIQQEQNKTTA